MDAGLLSAIALVTPDSIHWPSGINIDLGTTLDYLHILLYPNEATAMISPPTNPPSDVHPFKVGDIINNKNYSLTRKLANGPSSTVWLATYAGFIPRGTALHSMVPRGVSPFVAIKIMDAISSKRSTEPAMLRRLFDVARKEPDYRHINRVLEHFELQSSNGTHQCLVFELMSTTATSLLEELPVKRPNGEGVLMEELTMKDPTTKEPTTEKSTTEQLPDNQPKMTQRYPVWMAKRTLFHTLRGLALLHKNNIVHGNIQPDNLLIAIRQGRYCQNSVIPQLGQEKAAAAIPSHRINDKGLRDVYKCQHHGRLSQLDQRFQIKLCGFGTGKSPMPQPAVPPTDQFV